MSEWEKTICPLCGKPAKNRVYKAPRCYIYECDDCWDFGLPMLEGRKVKKLSHDDKKKLIEWRKAQPKDQTPIPEITKQVLIKVLKK